MANGHSITQLFRSSGILAHTVLPCASSSHYYPACFLRHDLPEAIYINTAGETHGLLLQPPAMLLRGPAFPHDAWTGHDINNVTKVRRKCKKSAAGTYAQARWRMVVKCNRTRAHHGVDAHVARDAKYGELARSRTLTCWSGPADWEDAFEKQKAYARLAGELSKDARLSRRCLRLAMPAYNEVAFRREYAQSHGVLAMFYAPTPWDGAATKPPSQSYSPTLAAWFRSTRRALGRVVPLVRLQFREHQILFVDTALE